MSEENEKTTYTKEEFDEALAGALKAKDHVKEELASLKSSSEAEKAALRQQILDLQNKAYGDEDKIRNSPLYKNMEGEFEKIKASYAEASSKIATMQASLDENALAQELKQNQTLDPDTISDLILRMKVSDGFTKTEKGWLSKDGKNVSDYLNELRGQQNAKHFFKRSIGSTQIFTDEVLKERQKQGTLQWQDMLGEVLHKAKKE